MTLEIIGGIDQTAYIDNDNCTITPLAAEGEWYGEWRQVGGHSGITVAPATDKDGRYGLQFSVDGVNIDSTLSRYYRVGRINPPHRFTITRGYYRAFFINEDTSDAQTYLRLETKVGIFTPLNVPSDAIIAQDYDATLVRPTDPRDEIALGKREGVTSWHKWGYNNDLDNGVSEMIWAPGGNMTFLTTASAFRVVSSDANDADGGTGAHGVVIYYVDENRMAQVVVVMLSGLTPVDTVVTGLGINRVAIFRAGSGQVNAGTITVTAVTGGTTQATMPAGKGVTQQAIFFTQAGHTALASSLLINIIKLAGGSSPKVTIRAWVLSFVSNARYQVFEYQIDTSVENHLDYPAEERFPIGEKSVLYFDATSDTNDTSCNLRFVITEHRAPST